MEIRVIDCDAIVGFVDYGTIDSEKNGGWSTKMRCKKCGAAWLAENYINGIETCPKCNATGKKCEGFGAKSVLKILDAIKESAHTTLSRFINSLSIPLIGKTTSKQISNACDNDIRTFMTVINQYGASYFSNIDGIGDTMITSFNNYWKKNRDKVHQLCTRLTFEKPTQIVKTDDYKDLSGLTFVITGSLNHFSNRDELKNKIETYGGKVSGSISAKTSYLINNDINSTSSKNQKAKSLNIPIISEKQFLSMIR